ncbi:MAG: hypothetical protein L5655_05810, partial [Thermosediminibacteraceae bacterium]|nr:hypothetical protein [Thermosediminibacteraceae bacterium]
GSIPFRCSWVNYTPAVTTIDIVQKRVLHADPRDSLNGHTLILQHNISEEFIMYHNKYIFKGELKQHNGKKI